MLQNGASIISKTLMVNQLAKTLLIIIFVCYLCGEGSSEPF